jgi:hypothetical protein
MRAVGSSVYSSDISVQGTNDDAQVSKMWERKLSLSIYNIFEESSTTTGHVPELDTSMMTSFTFSSRNLREDLL